MFAPGDDPAALNTPHRNILENYNNLKTEADPPMPCVQPADCPCWTPEQLSMVLPPSMNFDAGFENACDNTSVAKIIENFENVEDGEIVPPMIQLSVFELTNGAQFCNVGNTDYLGGPPEVVRLPVTDAELASCKSSLIAHANTHQVHNVVWDCF